LLENLPSRTQRQQTTHRTLRTQRNHPRTDLRAARSSATCPSRRRNLSGGRLCDRCCNRKHSVRSEQAYKVTSNDRLPCELSEDSEHREDE
jgi:hypothetical protein